MEVSESEEEIRMEPRKGRVRENGKERRRKSQGKKKRQRRKEIKGSRRKQLENCSTCCYIYEAQET